MLYLLTFIPERTILKLFHFNIFGKYGIKRYRKLRHFHTRISIPFWGHIFIIKGFKSYTWGKLLQLKTTLYLEDNYIKSTMRSSKWHNFLKIWTDITNVIPSVRKDSYISYTLVRNFFYFFWQTFKFDILHDRSNKMK